MGVIQAMEKDLLELERQHLKNVREECDPQQILELEEKFTFTYTYDALGVGENRMSYEDIKRISKAKALPDYSEREQKEILNHIKAFAFVKEEAKSGRPLNEEKLKDIHEILVEGIFLGGVYRNVNISIFGATHQPPDYVKVYDRMAKFFTNLEHFKGTPLEVATYAHASIAKIHPFVDANGRLAKLVLNFYLIQNNFLPISIPVEEIKTYIEKLEIFKTEKDLKPLTEFFRNLLIKRYEEVLQILDI